MSALAQRLQAIAASTAHWAGQSQHSKSVFTALPQCSENSQLPALCVGLVLCWQPELVHVHSGTHRTDQPTWRAAFAKGWSMTLVMLAVIPLMTVVVGMLVMMAGRLERTASAAYAEANSLVQETFAGIRTVFASTATGRQLARYSQVGFLVLILLRTAELIPCTKRASS